MDETIPETPGHEPCPELAQDLWERNLAEDQATLERAAFGAELRERCLRRLADAWRDINWRHLGETLRPPSIQLHRDERRWGAWHPDRRLITISERQVLCYTWESVTETLKHEMAHQWVSEAASRPDEVPHGPTFRAACRLLGCDPAASGDGGVPLFRPGGLGPREDASDARLRRIQKLLALADRNPDEHEARAAFARARELMLRMNLEAPPGPRGYVYRHLGRSTGRVQHHRYVIAGILQDWYFVHCIWVDSYDPLTGVRGHVLEVMGTRENVEMAEYVHDCLLRQCEALWRAFKRERAISDRRAKRQYLDGLLAGFRAQLRRTSQASEAHGLVWVGDPGLESWVRERYPRTRTARMDGVAGSDVRREGMAAGERLRLHRPVSASGAGATGRITERGRLLPG